MAVPAALLSDLHDLHFFIDLLGFFLRERGREGEGEHTTDFLFHSFMHSLVVSCMCAAWGSKPRPWCSGMTL